MFFLYIASGIDCSIELPVESNPNRNIIIKVACGSNRTNGREKCSKQGFCHIYPYGDLNEELCICDKNYFGENCSYGPFCSTGTECNSELVCIVYTDNNSVFKQDCVTPSILLSGQITENSNNLVETSTESNKITSETSKSGYIIALIVVLTIAAILAGICLFIVGRFYLKRNRRRL
jgi:hypothetical protein